MGKKILKWVVILGGIGLLAFVVYLMIGITQIYYERSKNKSIVYQDKAVDSSNSVSPHLDTMKKRFDSLIFSADKYSSDFTSVNNQFNALTIGYGLGSGFQNEVMFVTNMFDLNELNTNHFFKNYRTFIKLPWLTLKRINNKVNFGDFPLMSYVFYRRDNQSFLAIKDSKQKVQRIGFFIEINNYKLGTFSKYDDLNIYIPLHNQKKTNILYYCNLIFSLTRILIYLFLIWKSGSIVLAISNNKPFEWKNVKRLKQCVWTLLILIFLPYILMISLYLGFYKTLHGYVEMKSWVDIINWELWIILVIYFSLFLAFFRGNKLQTEQEYTI